MSVTKWLLVCAAAYGSIVTLAYLAQRSLMYFPESLRTPPARAGLPEAEEVVLNTSDGEKVIVWHVLPRGERPTVLYFHGNGGSLRYRVHRFRSLVSDGTGLVALSYRGYGGSTGAPTEAGLHADAAVAYSFAASLYPPQRIVVWGESLGSAMAIAVVAERPVGRVVLEAPFTSAVDIGANAYWFLPVRPLMKDQFRSDLLIGRIRAPLLILHGARDWVVPIKFGERLYDLANEPKQFVRFPHGGHEDLDHHGAQAAVRKFFETTF